MAHRNFRETLSVWKERFPGREAINAKVLARYLGQSPPVVREAIRTGTIPGRKIGLKYIITLNQLAHWETEGT